MIEQLTDGLAVLRYAKRRITMRLCIEVALYAALLVLAAVAIDIGRPWWSIALCFIVAAFWQVAAARTLMRLVAVRRDEVKLAGIVGGLDETVQALRAFGIPEDMLRSFTAPVPTSTTTDVDPDETPAPTSEGTKP